MTSRRGFLALAAAGAGSLLVRTPSMASTLSDRALTVDYSQRDHEIVDYQFYELEGLPGIKLRGPHFDPLAHDNFFTIF